MKKFLATIVVCIAIFSFVKGVEAADYTINCSNSSCSPSSISPLFPSSTIWYPGGSITKTIFITNNSGTNIKSYATETSATGNLDEVIDIKILRNSDSATMWSGTLHQLYATGEISLIANSQSDTFSYIATMQGSAGNEYQGKEAVFNVYFGFTTTLPGKTSSLSLPCTNSNFDAIMELKYNDVAQANINVRFTYKGSVQNIKTNSSGKAYAGYTVSGDDEVKAEPEEGYPSRTLTIRQSDCTKQTTSSSSSSSTSSSASSVTTVFLGPLVAGAQTSATEGEVEGAATEEAKPSIKPVTQGEVKGEQTKSCGCLWWPFFLGQLVVLAIYFFLLVKRRDENKKWYFVGAFTISAIIYALFLIFNSCIKHVWLIFVDSPVLQCKFFWLIELVMLGIQTGLWRYVFKTDTIFSGEEKKK